MPTGSTLRPLLVMLMLAAPTALGAQNGPPPGTVGAYLAMREALANSDLPNAPPYLERLLSVEPQATPLRESLTLARMSLGEFPAAVDSARRLMELQPDANVGALVLMTDAFARQDYALALEIASTHQGSQPMIDGLAQAWAHLGLGRMTEALAALDAVATQPGMEVFASYCRALALALVGDVEGALHLIEDPQAGIRDALSRRGLLAHAQLLGLVDRFDEALILIEGLFGPESRDPRVEAIRDAYQAGRAVPFDLLRSPADGMAEVFIVLANVLRGGQNSHDAVLYARAAQWIDPSMSEARLLLGQLFDETRQYDLAMDLFASIAPDDALFVPAAMGLAQSRQSSGDTDGAITALQALLVDFPDALSARHLLGDFLRRASRHEEAVAAYTGVIDALARLEIEPAWQIWFSRAASYERQGLWPQAEADFRRALLVEPDQPTVLNYLGYSLVERRENLIEALEMIERAVQGEPDSGYIVDSLAWALYRLGRYDEALPHMERAVELEPTDAILNDHLGDVYWAVGRQREARFQWRRALSFGPAEDLDMDRIRRKLDVGLDQVLIEEGAAPLHGR